MNVMSPDAAMSTSGPKFELRALPSAVALATAMTSV